MQKPILCYCTDWTLDVEPDGRELRCTPSWRTFGKNLAATLLAVILIGCQVYLFGFPPGAASLSAQRNQLEARQARIEKMTKRAAQLKASVGETGQQMARRFEAQAQRERGALQQARDQLANAKPTLGTIGDIAYWSFFALFVLIGVLPPAAVFWERITLRADGLGGVEVIRRGQLARSRRFPSGSFEQMVICVERVIHYSRQQHHTEDKGWRWAVWLVPRDPNQPPLIVCPEQEPTLPVRLEKLTGRVRQLVKFLSDATGLEPGPVVKADVSTIRPGFFGVKARGRVSGMGQADLSRHKPL